VRVTYDRWSAPGSPADVYEGPLRGNEFDLVGKHRFDLIVRCDDSMTNAAFESRIAGRLSDDGRAVTATEVFSYRLRSGELHEFRRVLAGEIDSRGPWDY
jgi:hypothetical protein